MAEPRIGVYICNCGTNIAKVVDCDAVAEAAAAHARRRRRPLVQVHVLQPRPGDDRAGHRATTASSASWSPPAARACTSPRSGAPPRRPGSTRTSCEMANIREQCSWVHDDRRAGDREGQGPGARGRATGSRSTSRSSGCRSTCAPTRWCIGGGIAGLTAALELADAGKLVVPRRAAAGRWAATSARVDLTAPYLDSARDMLTDRITRVIEHPRRRGHARAASSRSSRASSATSRPRSSHHASGEGPPRRASVDVGSVIVCTGYKEFDASRVDPPRLRQAAQRDHLLRVRAHAARRAASRRRTGACPSTWPIDPLRRQPQRGVPRLLLARLLHDGAQVRARGQVGAARQLRVGRVHRHARLRQGLRGLLPAQRRGQDAVPDVRQGRAPGDPAGRPRRRLRDAHHGRRAAVGRARSSCRPTSSSSWSAWSRARTPRR